MSFQSQNPPATGMIGWLAFHRGAGGLFLSILGAAILAVPVSLFANYHWDFLAVAIPTAALGMLCIAVGVMLYFLAADDGDADRVRMLVLLVGGCGGLLISATGASLAYLWWNYLPTYLRDEAPEGSWRLLVALVTILAGLAVMFIALQLARSEERTNPSLRRLVFGYNAVLSGVLLLILLAVANAFVSARYTQAIESVDRGDTTLSERATNIAKAIDRPIRFYVIWPADDDLIYPVRAFLSNLEDISSQVRVQYLSPTLDHDAVSDLARKYPGKIQERSPDDRGTLRGILVVKGDEKPENATFLPITDLYEQSMTRESSELKFKGEDRIIATLMSDKAIVYVTQGNGEPDLNDTNPRQMDRGLGVMRDRLNARGNLDVRALAINPADSKIPADCAVVIVANPRPPIGAGLQQALRNYLIDRRGKAIFLFDLPPAGGNDKTIPPTGLEPLLGQFDVEVTNERIFCQPFESRIGTRYNGEVVLLRVPAELARSGNELTRAFRDEDIITPSVRVVRPSPTPPNPMLHAETLLATPPGMLVWTETDLSADRDQTLEKMLRDPEAKKKLSSTSLPAAVIVTESAPPAGMPGSPPPAAKPRLVVFGDASFISNRLASEGSALPVDFAFFASTLDWLSERPTSIGVGAKSLKYYSLSPTTSGIALVFLPGVIAIVVILGLGLGVWTVRRR